MCGVWLAMEDVHPDAGPLTYVPSSQKWPILSNAMIGRRGFGAHEEHAQVPFEAAWRALVQSSGLQQETFLAKKGQALIWAANLLHGGSIQNDPTLTRWSQVTHYYFEDCTYYTPAFSDEPLGALDVRTIVDVRTGDLRPNFYLGEPVPSEQPASAPLAAIARGAEPPESGRPPGRLRSLDLLSPQPRCEGRQHGCGTALQEARSRRRPPLSDQVSSGCELQFQV
jgi:hypothetical protein